MSRKTLSSELAPEAPLSPPDRGLLQAAWETARERHGREIVFYLPGMIRHGRLQGRYPAVSITGNRCELLCEHCKGRLLDPMVQVGGPEQLVRTARRLHTRGDIGMLLSGGCDREGRLPWDRFEPALRVISRETSLFLSAHTGFPDAAACRVLRESGIRQGLIDVMGDREAATGVYHLPGLDTVTRAMTAIKESGLQLVPHLVAGLNRGKISAEEKALETLDRFEPDALVIVCLTPLKGTPMAGVLPPSPLEVARLIAKARLGMPGIPISLGCERPRNRDGWLLERLAIRAGVTRMAVWSESAVREAERLGLTPRFQATCCSLAYEPAFEMSNE